MSASLVGSEMCIRDSLRRARRVRVAAEAAVALHGRVRLTVSAAGCAPEPVSYTHLTLPTICSV
eukprot:13588922-Alexandrium_andersonii.AAC.1